jgi:hypothetical protein
MTATPPKNDEPDTSAISIIEVTEGSIVLDRVLRFCYPSVQNPCLDSLEELRSVLEAVRKYQLEFAQHSV